MMRACIALLLGLLAQQASASLMSIDLGSENLKVCLIKPGRTPIAIVVNESSRRKSPALVGFANQDRLLGEEAAAVAIRYPTSTFSRARDMLGRSASDPWVQNMLSAHSLPYELVDHPERKTAMAKINDTAAYLAEELVAGVLQYAKQITDAQAGSPIVDTVITVPAWFGIAQRQALKDAAALAGLNVLALVNSHSAAALQFGIERDFAAKEQKVILYDMGSGSTEVALVKFSTYSAKEPGSSKPKPINQFEVLDADWDADLGANTLDALLADHFAAQFSEKTGVEDVRKVPKAMAKLKRQVRRTKEILSANSDAPFSVEELHEGRDFQSSVSRADFEALAEKAGFWDRAVAPLKRLLERNGLKPGDVDAVELLGGGSRVPRLQSALSEVLGGRALDRHLDADEAVVLGGALFAANLSTSFRLRKFGMTDVAMYGVAWVSDDLGGSHAHSDDEEHPDPKDLGAKHLGPLVKNLLPAGKKLPIKRAVKFNNLTTDAFSFRLEYNETARHGLPPGHVGDAIIAQYDVSGVTGAIERYNHSGVTALRFEADWSGLVALDKAECVVEVEVMEERILEVPVQEGDAKDGAAADAKGGEKDGKDGKADGNEDKSGDKSDEKEGEKEEVKDGDKQDSDKKEGDKKDEKEGDKKDDKPKTVVKKIMVPKKKTFHVALKVAGAGPRHAPLSGGALTAAQANLTAYVLREAVKRDTARAKNDLEAYIIGTREKLDEEPWQAVTTDDQRSTFRESLMDAEDWLYGDGEAEAAAGFRKKLGDLRAVGEPMARRAAELTARPKAVSAARDAAELALKVAGLWPETKPWINATDADDMVAKVKDFLSWLQEQEAAQSKKAPHEDPAFESLIVTFKWEVVSKAFDRLNNKRKPRPPPEAKNKTEGAAEGATEGAEGGGAEGGEQGQQGGQPEPAAGEGEAEAQQQAEGGGAAGGDEDLPAHEEL
ncbi:MAG: Hsp70 protein-domain-containing protein [Monoraphidium minutum]|nr:MAG: Hsp70 protein-domain-containing protein [Monoraphidium minutum]